MVWASIKQQLIGGLLAATAIVGCAGEEPLPEDEQNIADDSEALVSREVCVDERGNGGGHVSCWNIPDSGCRLVDVAQPDRCVAGLCLQNDQASGVAIYDSTGLDIEVKSFTDVGGKGDAMICSNGGKNQKRCSFSKNLNDTATSFQICNKTKAAPSAPPAAAPKSLVTTANLRIRQGASADTPSLTIVPEGSTVEVVDPNPKNGWWKIEYRQVVGWSSGKYLQ